MVEFKAIIFVGFIFLFIGVILFYIARLFYRKDIEEGRYEKVDTKLLFKVIVIIGGLMILLWFKTVGHKWAAVAWGIILLALFTFGFIVSNKKNESD